MGYTSFQFRKLPPARLEHRDGLRHPVLFGKVTVRRHAGDRVWLRLAGNETIGATVVWSEGDRLGCKFDNNLDRSLFRALTLQTG